jgi:hypothetical protein
MENQTKRSDEAIGALVVAAIGCSLYVFSPTVRTTVDQFLTGRSMSTVNTQKLETATQKAVENGFKKGLQAISIQMLQALEKMCADETDPTLRKIIEDDCNKAHRELRKARASLGYHKNSDGKWELDHGCRWLRPDDESDLSTRCD